MKITKQKVQAVADLKAGYTLGHADVAILNELARLALASLEAEAVGFIDAEYAELLKSGHIESCSVYAEPGEGCIALYAAQPAAVSFPLAIHDEDFEKALLVLNDTLDDCGDSERGLLLALYKAGIEVRSDACRAAMLQGADNEQQRKAAIHDVLCEKYNVESLADFVDWQRNHIAELEAAPPAPVGKGETAVMPDYPGYALTQRECYQAGKKAGLAEAGNSPVIPDGWVACSERMPPEYEPVYIFHPDYGVSQYVWYDHHEDAFVWDDETRFRELESVSHWMAMPAPPAAPEQEDK